MARFGRRDVGEYVVDFDGASRGEVVASRLLVSVLEGTSSTSSDPLRFLDETEDCFELSSSEFVSLSTELFC